MLSKGQVINERYEILKSIGEGGMANVYLAHDKILDRDVAIKVLRGDLENNEKFIRRFQREAKSVSDLSHPNIVEVYDVGEEDGQHYIVMEYIDGKTLKQLIQKRGSLTVPEVIDIMAQLTDGLAQAHDAYIIHRDIKPQNIMILDNGMIKITDFGIAMSMNATQLTQTNSVMGSVHYLPPEQASGKGATTKSDIYSAGILMYELLTGSVPFKGDNAVEIALKQMKERIPSIRRQNPLIPQSVENIVLKATAKNPKNRYDNIHEMHDDIVHALDEDRQNEVKYHFPYPESELDESRAIPIKESTVTQPKANEVEIPANGEESGNAGSRKKEKKKMTRTKILILVGLVVILLMSGTLIFLNHRNNTKVIVVPDVTNQKVDKAISTLKKKGFKYDVKKEASDKIKEGYVIETQPSAGSSKRKGSIITIVESTGLADVVLEDYTDQNASSLKKKLEKLGLKVTIEKKEVKSPKDYIGKTGVVIDQSPQYVEKEETKLKKGDELTLYIPDIYDSYPEIATEGWTLSKAEDFANQYGLSLVVKDKKGNVVSDYSSYLDKAVTGQNRTGKIASGVQFVVTIDVDMTTYNLTINYYLKGSTESIFDTKVEKHKDGESGTVTCPGKASYDLVTPQVNYQISGKDAVANCYYTKSDSGNNTDTGDDLD